MLIAIEKIKVAERIRKQTTKVDELAADIKKNGLINPITVMEVDGGARYQLLAGLRRLRAAQLLGWSQIESSVAQPKDAEGTKFDCVPVLDGEQGIGKSTIIKDLVTPEYYSESLSLTDMDDKSGAEKLQGFWVVEIGELAGMKKADIEKVKAFLSTSDDKYRPSYGKTVESHPRQCIIIATVNGERGYLRDITGNRRFWVIKLHQQKQKQKWYFDQNFRDQFWAEAKAIYEAGETLYLEGDNLDAAEKAQRAAMEIDERIGMVEEYLNTLLPETWNEMDLYARREYLSDTSSPLVTKGWVLRTTVSNAEIWCECFGRSFQDLKPTDSYAIAALMTQIPGWERTTERVRQPLYGRHRLYRKID